MSKLYIILLGLKYWIQLFAKVDLLWWRGIILRDNMGISWNSIDDDGRIIDSRPANFDSLSSIIDNDHLLNIHFALKILAPVKNVSTHFVALLHQCIIVTYYLNQIIYSRMRLSFYLAHLFFVYDLE